MKILLVGGCLKENCMGGDTNVIKSIASIFAEENDVCIFPYLPVIKNDLTIGIEEIRIINKRMSYNVLSYYIKNALSWGKVVYPFLKMTPRGVLYLPITLFNRAIMEEEIRHNRPDVIHIHGLPIDSMPFINAAFDHDIPVVATLHGLYSLDYSNNLYFKRSLERLLILKLAAKNMPITTVSTAVKNNIAENFSIDPDMLKIILNGVDPKRVTFCGECFHSSSEKYGIPNDKFIFLQVGNLSRRKNHIVVLNAIAEMDLELRERLHYVIVGSGNEDKTLRTFVKNKKLKSSVTFLGRISDDQLAEMYNLSDFFILPSTSEGLALVFLEAMVAGLPIISFKDLEGVSDVYDPNCMELIPDRSINAIINSIRCAIEKKWDREKIKNTAQNFAWERICNQYIQIYLELISRPSHTIQIKPPEEGK